MANLWAGSLVALSPALGSDAAQAAVAQLVNDLAALALAEPFEATAAYGLGERLEALDSLQPRDLAVAQEALCEAFSACLSPADWDVLEPRLVRLLFGVGAGFYAGRSARAGRFEMNAMSRMGHDLKTPINAITGFSRVILKGIDGPITDFQREDLTSIYEAGQRLLTMINDLSTVRKQDAGRTLLLETPFAVSDLLADVLRTIQPAAGERGHVLSITTVGPLDAVAADASMIRWILLGLLLYVLRQGVDGEIALQASREGETPMHLIFEIEYMPSRHLPADARLASAPPEQPADIGLLTCQRFCEDLGGTLARADGDGVSFTVRLPVAA